MLNARSTVQMNSQHGRQRIHCPAAFTLRIIRFDYGDQTLSGQHLLYIDQETLATDLLTFSGVLGTVEDTCFIGAKPFNSCEVGISPNLEVFFQNFLRCILAQ